MICLKSTSPVEKRRKKQNKVTTRQTNKQTKLEKESIILISNKHTHTHTNTPWKIQYAKCRNHSFSPTDRHPIDQFITTLTQHYERTESGFAFVFVRLFRHGQKVCLCGIQVIKLVDTHAIMPEHRTCSSDHQRSADRQVSYTGEEETVFCSHLTRLVNVGAMRTRNNYDEDESQDTKRVCWVMV